MRRILRWVLLVAALLISTDAALLAGRWVNVGPPGGAGVALIAVDPATPATIYAALGALSGYRGVYKSVNGGTSWIPANNGVESVDVAALAIASNRPLTLYAGGTGIAPQGNTVGRGVSKSTDGETWTPVNDGLEDTFVHALAIDPTDSSVVYAGTNRGISRTRNGGSTWVSLIPSAEMLPTPVGAIAIDPTSPGTLYASTDRGLIKTSDGGSRWKLMNDGLTNPYLSQVIVHPAAPSTVFAVSTSAGVVFKTEDGGDTWRAIRTGLPDTFIHALGINPLSPTIVYAGTERGLYFSGDGGSTWAPVNGLEEQLALSLAFDPSDASKMYAGTGNGLFRSADGGVTWDHSNEGISGFRAVVAVDPFGRGNVYAGAYAGNYGGGLFKSPDGGRSWAEAPGLTGSYIEAVVVDPASPSTLYAGGGTLWKSVDAGGSWSISDSGLGWMVSALAIDPTNSATLYAGTEGIYTNFPPTGGGVFKSTDGGKSWSAANNGMRSCKNCSYPLVAAVVIDPSRPATLYASALYARGGIFKSVDAGANWSRVTENQAYALAIDPRSPSTVHAGGFRSTDGGATWTNTSLSSLVVYSLTTDARSGAIYAGTGSEGVFRSLDGGESWAPVGEGLGGLSVMSLALDPSGKTLYAGTFSGGVFTLSLQGRPVAPRTRVVPRRGR